MDNLAHTLVGLAAAKAGLERASPYATAVCVIAANAPDADIVAALKGRWFYLQHHRGITHSVVGTLALAVLVPVFFYAAEKMIMRVRAKPPRTRLRGLLLASVVAGATHPLLDWTNNYGVRPFLPWSGKWYYGDLVFIIDPWLWLALGGAAFLATARTRWRTALWSALALALTVAIVLLPVRADLPTPARALWLAGVAAFAFAHRLNFGARFGRAVPAVALALVPAYWCALAVAHSNALRRGEASVRDLSRGRGESVSRVAAMPSLADPARWRVVGETERADYVFNLSLTDTHDGATAPGGASRHEKLSGADAERVARLAREDERARIFLHFARFPLARISESPGGAARAQLYDVRYAEPGADPRRATFAAEFPLEPEP
ncbi:MAG: metal-dependent hydrolase [Acidobacteria bacterium]|nr:metal-dependent hydrolase [Acidobacteriota bacterium]MCA1641352.1 metal-dependent hydrolase [Acidobacteriota bacterium]